MSARDQALRDIAAMARQHGLDAGEIAAALVEDAGTAPARRASGVLARVLGYLGGVLVLAGIALLVGMQWEQFGSAARVLVTLGTGFTVFLFALATLTDPRFAKVTTPMLLVAAVLQPTGIMVMLEEYSRGGRPEHGVLFMCVVMFAQQFLTFLATRRTVLLFMSLFFGAAGFGTLCGILEVDWEAVSLAMGAGLIALSRAIDRTAHRVIAPLWYFAGSSLFLAGAFGILEDTALEIVFFGLAAGVMYLGTVVGSRTLLFVSVIALTIFTGYYFRDSLINAFGLIVIGVVLIGLSAFAMSLNRRFIRRSGENSQGL